MKRLFKNKINPAHIHAQPHVNSGGSGQSKNKNRAASFLSHWRGVGQQPNDNATLNLTHPKHYLYMQMAAFSVMFAMMISLNNSTIITQAVLHADDSVLSAAMEVSPDAVAYMLNKMDVGVEE